MSSNASSNASSNSSAGKKWNRRLEKKNTTIFKSTVHEEDAESDEDEEFSDSEDHDDVAEENNDSDVCIDDDDIDMRVLNLWCPTPVSDRMLLSSVSSKDECKVSISVGLITLMFSGNQVWVFSMLVLLKSNQTYM